MLYHNVEKRVAAAVQHWPAHLLFRSEIKVRRLWKWERRLMVAHGVLHQKRCDTSRRNMPIKSKTQNLNTLREHVMTAQ
jgi:hypothetical protein